MDALNITKLDPTPEHPYTRYFLDVRVRVGGKPKRKRETLRGSYGQAKARYFELQALLRAGGRESSQPPGTFGEILDRYAQNRGTLPASQRTLFENLKRDLGAVPLRDLEDALARYSALLRSTVSRRGARFSAATINRHRGMAAAALNLAVATRILDRSPLHAGNWPKAREIARDRFLSPLEVRRLLNVIEQEAPHLGPLVRFALQVPCRRGELVRMTRADLDLFHNAIRVHNGTTKNDEGSWKPIPPDMVEYFRSLPPETPFLFFRRRGGRFLPLGDFKRSWDRCKRLAGIEDFHFHDTRHISATNMIDAGTPERVVMDVAGWKTNMLSTYYKSSSKKALAHVIFPSGKASRVHPGYTIEGESKESGEITEKKAVLG